MTWVRMSIIWVNMRKSDNNTIFTDLFRQDYPQKTQDYPLYRGVQSNFADVKFNPIYSHDAKSFHISGLST